MFIYSDPDKGNIRQKITDIVRNTRHFLIVCEDGIFQAEERNRFLSELGYLERAAAIPAATLDQLNWLYQKACQLHRKCSRHVKGAPTLNNAVQNSEEPSTESEEGGERYVPVGKHVLPPLPYPYDALEPYIDEKTMRLHHDKHHKSYVEGLNKAETMMAQARKTGDFNLIKHWEREAAFNGAGHYLHTIFWNIMNPRGGGEPEGDLKQQIRKDFGSFEAFKKHFSNAAEKVEGGGWAILVWSPRSRRLEILQAEKHQNLTQWDVIPLLVLDVWEHAYYLKYNDNRKKYIQAWWHVVHWPAVDHRYQKARKVRWKPY
ncbi:hypothetical protein GCM10011571_18540 [Marinithermofilum abyssi]|uniref:superoxide dismutase n=1 Tax=Marinithermofilum abyssi TaxID=1571185 RepID=A0A8J2VGK4_9BACL|nr:superoxide dismutase [Marinithermofilum abyssi]GGE17139.1 hypothetical protein GCM10011571_18540 [Marinithermofilum abyssi]